VLQITISHNSIFFAVVLRATVGAGLLVHRNLSDEPMKGTSDGGRGSPGVHEGLDRCELSKLITNEKPLLVAFHICRSTKLTMPLHWRIRL
jgi:hypothetical protein